MTIVNVKAHTRGKPDPFQDIIDAKMAERIRQAEAKKRMNEFRDSIGWKRPAIIDRMLSAFGIGRR